MSAVTQNQQWPMVAELSPQLRRHIETFSQLYRDERWYVLRDEVSGRHLRFNSTAYELIGRLDGVSTVEDIWYQLQESHGESALTQDEVIHTLTQLFSIDALRSGLPADAKALFKRFQQEQRQRRQRAVMNPLSIRVPLFDPDRLLNYLSPRVATLFSKTGAALWLLVVGIAALLTLTNFAHISSAVDQDIISPANLPLMVLMYVVIKTLHEFAHAFTVKRWGGEVHEMGITLLVFVPIPYVDASATWGFRDKYRRALVGAVGILSELFLASLALFVWLAVEPGLIKDAALNAFLIGTVSTILFNANPLLKFDGYYVLQDLVEIPNLYTRSGRYWLYLIQKYLFGLEQAHSPVTAHGERGWFSVYGLAAFFYRFIILTGIVLFLAQKYLAVGVAIGVWAVIMQVMLPLSRALRFLAASPALSGNRLRASMATAMMFIVTSCILLFIPFSQTTHAEGVVWMSDHSNVYAGSNGFIREMLVQPGSAVTAGMPLLRMENASLQVKIEKLVARRRELELRKAAEYIDRLQTDITAEEINAVDAELDLLKQEVSALLVHSEVAGTYVLPQAQNITGRYLHKGDLIGHVISPERMIVRAVVPQSDIGLLRERVSHVDARFAERLADTVSVNLVREIPSASTTLPNRALGVAGGGSIAITRTDSEGLTAAEKVFQVDLGLPQDLEISGVGERAYLRFYHGTEPLASQWYRSGRQLLLSRLNY